MASAKKLDELKTLLKAGARANKYKVQINGAAGVTIDAKNADILCKAASFPATTIGQIEVWNQGRKLVIPGDTSFDNTWNLTFYSTEDHALRKQFIDWMVKMDDFRENKHYATPGDVMAEMIVSQLDNAGNETAKYKFYDCFPQNISEITVGDDSTDTLVEFDVTFSFTNWEKIA